MIDCIVLGDSIAVGTQLQRHECVSYAKSGINSWQWNKMYGDRDLTAGTVIISLGTNDHKGVKTEQELLTMRSKVKASKVYWILPHDNLKASEVPIKVLQNIVRQTAAKYGDVVLPITNVSRDNIHPSWTGYRELANKTKGE